MIHFLIGRSYFNQKKYKAAGEHFSTAIKIKPNYALARLNYARTCDLLGDHKVALKEYLSLEKEHPEELREPDKKRIAILSNNTSPQTDSKIPDRNLSTAHTDPPELLKLPMEKPFSANKPKPMEKDNAWIKESSYFAVLIGVESYDSPDITDLDRPITDIESLKDLLCEKYTFAPDRVQMLRNPSRRMIMNVFYNLTRSITRKDNLLIFYAGHGYWDKKFKIGYWLPKDAQRDDRTNWIPNSTIRDFIRVIDSRHTLMIADACFSGSIFKTRKAFETPFIGIEEIYKLPSRKAITSGTMTEVPDESVFVNFFLKKLSENERTYITSQLLFTNFRTAVINNSVTKQVPQYGTIYGCGDEGGDFIFVRRTP